MTSALFAVQKEVILKDHNQSNERLTQVEAKNLHHTLNETETLNEETRKILDSNDKRAAAILKKIGILLERIDNFKCYQLEKGIKKLKSMHQSPDISLQQKEQLAQEIKSVDEDYGNKCRDSL